jgi:hypothetical protein
MSVIAQSQRRKDHNLCRRSSTGRDDARPKVMANLNPITSGLKSNKKGERRGGRQLGTPNKPKTLDQDLTAAAIRLGFFQEVEVKTLDQEGKETTKTKLEFTGKDGREGYLMWLGMNVPAPEDAT